MPRTLELLLALLAAISLAPAMLLVALLIAFFIGRPVLFQQTRPGLSGRAFKLVKFRTMTDDRNANGELLPDAERLPKFGRLLRATSLDELPELWNVLRGDMSLVGPRPLLMDYLPLYNERQRKRHDVRPGITGWAQVNGRNELAWPDRLEQDVWYVENRSLWLDIKILFMTVKKVLIREGISAQGEATMSKFEGNKSER
jgi:lipopolysaccharide/colanic/teichoic acid biosynthesis glycosyltransferase